VLLFRMGDPIVALIYIALTGVFTSAGVWGWRRRRRESVAALLLSVLFFYTALRFWMSSFLI
jgi:hypothetical protein